MKFLKRMKKTSIYLLSILVIVVLALSVLLPSGQILKLGWESFSAGFEMGMNHEEPLEYSPLQVQFVPTTATMIQPPDSIRFEDGSMLPVVIDSMAVMVPDSKIPAWTTWTLLLLTPLQIVLLCIILWKFLRFIINVSKARIFVNQNVKYLRQTSFALIAIAAIQTIGGLIQDHIFGLFQLSWEGYELGAYWSFPWSNLIIAVVGLLLAQVWAYGIQIEKEQELTI